MSLYTFTNSSHKQFNITNYSQIDKGKDVEWPSVTSFDINISNRELRHNSLSFVSAKHETYVIIVRLKYAETPTAVFEINSRPLAQLTKTHIGE